MTKGFHAEIDGLAELIDVTDPKILSRPLRNFFNRSSETVKNNIKPLTPVDRGRLRSSMSHVVDSSSPPLWARIGTNVKYAKPVEFGTGKLSDAPDSSNRRYFPPPSALDVWAKRHGFTSGYQVAFAIWKRGGTAPRRMMRDGFDASVQKINSFLADAAREIGLEWKI